MTYWHMQLHPNDIDWNREEELLENRSLVGLGLATKTQTQQFKSEMKVDDIVFVKRGGIPIALVKVVGDLEDIYENKIDNLDWFRYRRKVKILDWVKNQEGEFSATGGALQKAIDKDSETYKYIDKWYNSLLNRFYNETKGLKIKKIYIEKFKMFQDVTFDFCYPENINGEKNPIPIVVLAGINGTGKTTLLDYLSNFSRYIIDKDEDKSFIELEKYENKNRFLAKLNNDTSCNLIRNNDRSPSPLSLYFNSNIVTIPVDEDIKDMKEFIPIYLDSMIYNEDLKASQAFNKIRKYINTIFEDLNIQIEFDSIDAYKNLLFRNKNGEKFLIDNLSTGEKTLISKLLSLYLKEIKDKIILIDEPELSLHPNWQNKILGLYEKFAKTNNCQIIIATHSPHIIGSAKNEYIRVLKFNNENNIEVISNISQSYGLEFHKVLTDIMGVEELRTPAIEKDIRFIKKMIFSNEYKASSEFKKTWIRLEKSLGESDLDLKLLKLEINRREKEDAKDI